MRDIVEAIGLIEQFVMEMDFEAFREDPKTIAAVERKLLVVSEAPVCLGNEAEVIWFEVPWRDDPPRLKAAVTRALNSLRGRTLAPFRRQPYAAGVIRSVLPAVTYTFSENVVSPALRISMV
jgi:hypothetical protein